MQPSSVCPWFTSGCLLFSPFCISLAAGLRASRRGIRTFGGSATCRAVFTWVAYASHTITSASNPLIRLRHLLPRVRGRRPFAKPCVLRRRLNAALARYSGRGEGEGLQFGSAGLPRLDQRSPC